MDLLTFLGIIAAIVTIAGGIGTAVYFFRKDPDTAKPVIAIAGTAVVVILIVALIVSQTRGASGSQQTVGNDQHNSSPTSTSTVTNTPTVTPTPRPTATSAPPGTVLYQETGSDNWSGWTGSSEWKMSNGMLINDGSQGFGGEVMPSIVAPFQPSTPNYSIEVQARLPNNICASTFGWFGISARLGAASGSTTGYSAYVRCASVTGIKSSEKSLVEHCCFDPGTGWHTYRFELRGTTLNYYIDGLLALSAEDAQYLSAGGQIGFRDDHALLYIRSCVVKAL
ncbi:MAG TPA: hypothetical protein VH349_05480 [Ktedonobacterales bacterium]|jgi:hypothetical protein